MPNLQNGTEDGKIQCTQEGAVTAPAKDKIARITSEVAGHDDKDSNPFTEIEEDKEELEQNCCGRCPGGLVTILQGY